MPGPAGTRAWPRRAAGRSASPMAAHRQAWPASRASPGVWHTAACDLSPPNSTRSAPQEARLAPARLAGAGPASACASQGSEHLMVKGLPRMSAMPPLAPGWRPRTCSW